MTQEEIDNLNKEQAMGVGNQLAFPLSTGSGYPSTGMTKREYMVTQLMAGLLNTYAPELAVGLAIKGVDLLLIQLNKK